MPHETVRFDRFLGQVRKILEMIEKEGRSVKYDKEKGTIEGAPILVDAIAKKHGLQHQTQENILNGIRLELLSRLATLRADVEALEGRVQGLPIDVRIGKGILGDDLQITIRR